MSETTTAALYQGDHGWGLIVGLLLLGLTGSGGAEDQTRALPRAFQQVRLGMTSGEFMRLKPDLAKTKRRNLATVSLSESSTNPYIRHIVYRFHAGTLYEVEIRYRPDRLQHGASGLLGRLKEVYGQPIVDRADEVDLDSGDLHRRRTVWEDGKTRITVLEREYFSGGKQEIELTLTMTDLYLARLRDTDQNEQARRKLQEVPIPL